MLMVEHFMAEAINAEDSELNADEQGVACLNMWAAKFVLHQRDYALKNFKRPPLQPNSGHGSFCLAAPPEQAEFWFFIDRATTPGSLVWVCNLFGIDANRVRTHLQPNWRTIYANIKPMAFKAPSQAPLQLPVHEETMVEEDGIPFKYEIPRLADFKSSVFTGRNTRT